MKGLRAKVEILSAEEIQRIHKASLEIFEGVGLHMPNDEGLRRCEKLGAQADYEQGIMRIPVSVMEDFLKQLKRDSETDQKTHKGLYIHPGVLCRLQNQTAQIWH